MALLAATRPEDRSVLIVLTIRSITRIAQNPDARALKPVRLRGEGDEIESGGPTGGRMLESSLQAVRTGAR